MKTLWRHLKPYKIPLFLGPFFKLLEAIFELILPLVMALMIDIGVNQQNSSVLRNAALAMLGLVILGMIVSFAAQYMASLASQGFGTNLREAIFAKLTRLTPTAIQKIGSASITNRATYDVNQLQLTTAMVIRLLTRAPFLSIFGVVMAWRVSPMGGRILLFAIIPAAIVIYVIYRISLPYFERARLGIDKVSRLIMDLLSGVRVIRAFNRQGHEERYFAAANEELERDMRQAQRLSGLMNPLTTLILNVAIFFLLRLGGETVGVHAVMTEWQLTEGELLALINYANQVLMALTVAANMFNLLTRTKNSAERVIEVLDSPDIEPLDENQISPDPIPGAPLLALEHVDFHYAGSDQAVLKDLTFRLEQGQTLGILGPTGSGKTTLLDVILRHYEVSGGELRLEGQPADRWSLKAWRSYFSIAPQKPTLITGSIRDNLRWGLGTNHLTREEEDQKMWDALELAQGASFVRALPEGLDSPVNRGGRNFSGGQRQRLSLARALLKEAPILVQDDSSSALDFATDAAIRRGLQQEREGLTRIIVSQRVHTIMDAELILVIDGGRIVAQGRHQELLETSRLYREICAYQLQDVELAEDESSTVDAPSSTGDAPSSQAESRNLHVEGGAR